MGGAVRGEPLSGEPIEFLPGGRRTSANRMPTAVLLLTDSNPLKFIGWDRSQ